ncbi:MAG: cellulase family glycosylhydrolase [Candidatus Omnitrophota bacterium]
MSRSLSFLRVKGRDIVDEDGKKIYLRGVNLGSWLLLEGYFFQGRNFGEHIFKKVFARHNGREQLEQFMRLYRQQFISYEDIRRVKALGANCVRLPFNYRILDREKRIDYLDRAISWCRKEKIWCILDLHAAPGAQNPDWHSDSDGKARFWQARDNQRLFLSLWRDIARRYKDEPVVAGYDVLNEAVVKDSRKLCRLYDEVTEVIRQVDQKHILFLEANHYGQQLEPLGKPKDNNTAYSIHMYLPISFTFNFHLHLKYPGMIEGLYWDKKRIYSCLKHYDLLSRKWKVPIYVGEFGINFRSGHDYGELRYLEDALACFRKYQFHWTYWTYKAIANSQHPDGIYQYLPDPPWVKRGGPIFGWENFYHLWKTHKREIVDSWKTESFTKNKYLAKVLSRYF